jgi:hypothetical protein
MVLAAAVAAGMPAAVRMASAEAFRSMVARVEVLGMAFREAFFRMRAEQVKAVPMRLIRRV